MSRFHTLQSSTTRERLLKSLRESLRKNGIDPFKYIINEEDDIEHASIYLQTPSLIQSQNCGNILGSEKQHHGMTSYNDQAELGHQVHMQDAGGSEGNAPGQLDQALGLHDAVHQQYNYQYIGCGHNVNILHNEDNGLTGYVHDDYYRNDLIAPDQQCMIGYGHEGNRQMLESSTYFSFSDNNVILSSLEPSIGQLVHRMQHSSTSPAFDRPHQDDCRFPTELESSRPTLHLHPAYPHLDSQHNYQEFQQNPQFQDMINIGMATSMQYITHEARCNDNAINVKLPVAIHPSTEAQVSKTTCCAKAASLPPSQHRKRPRLPADTINAARRNDCFDESNGSMEDAVDIGRENCSSPNAAKASGFSSNLVCERRRRKKINEALYALRSVVPIVSKMDKASIMSDALTYAKQLRKQVDDLQTDILNLQVGNDDVERTSIDQNVQEESSGRGTNNPNKGEGVDVFEKYFQSLPKHKILELTVFNMETNTYQLRICCKKGPGDLLQLARVIEALDFDILNSSVTSVGDQSIINTVVVKVDTDQVLKPEEVKEMMLEIVSKNGWHM